MSTIGLDLGTSQVKAVRFDNHWQAVDTEAETTALQQTSDGWSEQDMLQVWAAATRTISKIAARSPDGIDLLALTAQGDGCWLVDAHGDPVRPAILWNDNRAAPIIDRWESDGTLDRAFRVTGCYGASGLPHAQMRWLRRYEPEALDRAARLLSAGSWIYQQLTGRQVLEVSDAANPFLDARLRTYDDQLLEEFGLGEHRRLLPELVSGGDRIAPLLTGAAGAVGLPAGTPVGLAPYDVPATAIGTGTVQVGQAFAVLGTTLCVGVVADTPMLTRPPNGMTLPGTAPDRWLIAYATMTGTEVLDWTTTLLGLPDVAALIALAGTADPGVDAPTMLPYLSPAGERSPFRDSTIRGSLHGISLRHSRADIARAALDSLTLAITDCLHATGQRPTSLALAGGGAQSPLWCQAISDATCLPVNAPDTPQVGARGAILSAAADLGTCGTLPQLVENALRPARTHLPHPQESERFAASYRLLHSRRSDPSSHPPNLGC